MNDINNEESIRQILQATYKPVVASSTFKDELRKQLRDEVAAKAKEVAIPVWKRLRLWVPIAVVLVVALIGYGLWAPSAISPPITPSPTPVPTPSPSPFPSPPAPPVVVKTGTLEIRVTDAPPQRDVREINVNLANIEIYKADETGGEGEWVPLPSEPKLFDLMKLRESGADEILGEWETAVGHYTQIRMDVEVVDALIDGERVDVGVVLPSGKLKIVGSFNIEPELETVLVLDFDADKSLVFTGEGKVLFKPVVKLIVTYED